MPTTAIPCEKPSTEREPSQGWRKVVAVVVFGACHLWLHYFRGRFRSLWWQFSSGASLRYAGRSLRCGLKGSSVCQHPCIQRVFRVARDGLETCERFTSTRASWNSWALSHDVSHWRQIKSHRVVFSQLLARRRRLSKTTSGAGKPRTTTTFAWRTRFLCRTCSTSTNNLLPSISRVYRRRHNRESILRSHGSSVHCSVHASSPETQRDTVFSATAVCSSR